jgi:hypothetical protein
MKYICMKVWRMRETETSLDNVEREGFWGHHPSMKGLSLDVGCWIGNNYFPDLFYPREICVSYVQKETALIGKVWGLLLLRLYLFTKARAFTELRVWRLTTKLKQPDLYTHLVIEHVVLRATRKKKERNTDITVPGFVSSSFPIVFYLSICTL